VGLGHPTVIAPRGRCSDRGRRSTRRTRSRPCVKPIPSPRTSSGCPRSHPPAPPPRARPSGTAASRATHHPLRTISAPTPSTALRSIAASTPSFRSASSRAAASDRRASCAPRPRAHQASVIHHCTYTWRALCSETWHLMGKKDSSAPLIHDATTLRALADEADGRRHRTSFGHLGDTALLQTMADALRACADGQQGDKQDPSA
jgi:hypothetical protein